MNPVRRLAIVVACFLGATVAPAVAAPLTVTSGSLSMFRTCSLTPLTGASTVGFDTYVDQSLATTNFGSATGLTVQSRNSSRNMRVYIRFDLSQCSPAIPSSATVSSALLRMVPIAVASNCRTYDIFRVSSSWVESSATWSNQPFGTSINNPPTASRTSSSNIGAAPCTNTADNVYTSGWDVTSDVRAFVTGTVNNGWMIRDDIENSGSTARTTTFYSSDTGSIASAQLIINYS
jgi:hypothetical protein